MPRLGLVREEYLPPVSRIAGALVTEAGDGAFWAALGDTLTGWALGLAIAVGAGIAVGVVLSVVPYLREATASTIEFLRPIPSVALIRWRCCCSARNCAPCCCWWCTRPSGRC